MEYLLTFRTLKILQNVTHHFPIYHVHQTDLNFSSLVVSLAGGTLPARSEKHLKSIIL